MKYPCQWIADKMSQPSNTCPQWWREIKASGRTNLGACIVHTGHNDPDAQHYTLWQVAAIRLQVLQQKASRWWDAPPTLHGLCPWDFLTPASDPQNFQIIRQEKTLALARVLQVCTEASRAKTGILCGAVRELQQCMVPLMTLNGDDVMEASLLRPADEELGPSPTPKEETSLMGEGDGPLGVAGPTPRYMEIPRFVEPAEWTTTPITTNVPHSCPSWKGKKSWEGSDVDSNNPSQWIQAYLERGSRLPEWWEEFHPLVHSMDRHCDDAQVKSMACWQAVPFHLQASQREVHSAWITPPCLAVLGKERISCPCRPKDNLGLSGGAEGGDVSAGCCTQKVCHSCRSLSKCILWGGARAP